MLKLKMMNQYNIKWLIPNAQNQMEPITITLEANGQYIEEDS